MARKKCCSRGPNIGKAIGEAQTQTNRTQVVPIPGLSAYELYMIKHPDSTLTEDEYTNGDFFESNFYTENEL